MAETASQASAVDITPYVDKLRALVPNVPPPEQPREAVRLFGIQLEEVETQGSFACRYALHTITHLAAVTEVLNRARLPSPPSTLLLASSVLKEVTDETVRTELIRRCLRYVSPGPWGSLWAEGHGDRDIYQRIAKQFWPSSYMALLERRVFTAGAGVVAHPVSIPSDPRRGVRFRSTPKMTRGETEGWLLCRAEPYQNAKFTADLSTVVDVTDKLIRAMGNPRGRGGYSMLYDHRFFLDFDLRHMPFDMTKLILTRSAKVVVRPETKWMLPNVTILGDQTIEIGRLFWKIEGWQQPKRPPLKHSYVRMKHVRTLDAI